MVEATTLRRHLRMDADQLDRDDRAPTVYRKIHCGTLELDESGRFS
jgi:hypothetical protein